MNTDDKKYGIPELKKFPMPDADHVRSAIRFFNYVTPAYEKELANAIKARMREYGMSFDDFTVGEENRFSKYIPKDELKHYGILGMHWGVRRYQNADGSLTSAGKKRYGADDSDRKARNRKLKKAAVVAGAALVAGAAVYASYKHFSAGKLTSSSATVNAGKQFVDQMSEMVSPLTVDKIVKPQRTIEYEKELSGLGTKAPKINLTFDATIDPNQDLAKQVRKLKSEIYRQAEAIKNSPDMQNYVEELLRRG